MAEGHDGFQGRPLDVDRLSVSWQREETEGGVLQQQQTPEGCKGSQCRNIYHPSWGGFLCDCTVSILMLVMTMLMHFSTIYVHHFFFLPG